MNFFQRLKGHFITITTHRHKVMMLCFKCGLYKQGLIHDLSKYSFIEFIPSVKYYQGFQSPITAEKKKHGYSLCWLHHKGINRHHWEYWVDRLSNDEHLTCIEMPFNYMLESVLDRIAASKVYNKDKYEDYYPHDYLIKSHEYYVMNKNTAHQIEVLLKYLKDNGEEKALAYYKSLYRKFKNNEDIIL